MSFSSVNPNLFRNCRTNQHNTIPLTSREDKQRRKNASFPIRLGAVKNTYLSFTTSHIVEYGRPINGVIKLPWTRALVHEGKRMNISGIIVSHCWFCVRV